MNKPDAPLILMQEIRKEFGSVIANDDVYFALLPGEIHGLLGENGAGKTTLMNILYGMHRPDSGVIYVDGQEQTILSPHDAIALGIGMVHQHFMQVPTMTVIDNVILGLKNDSKFVLDREKARTKLIEVSTTYGLKIDPDAFIWQLSIGDRQRVEILKALYRNVKVLILDEPTSVLTPLETEELFHTVRKMVSAGLAVIFITHNLEEAIEITDRITVLRNGMVMGTIGSKGTTKQELASMMVGREVLFRTKRTNQDGHSFHEVLKVDNISVIDDRVTKAVRNVSFTVNSGEIVGLAGVDGNGQSELAQALTGLRPIAEGAFYVDGVDLTNASPRAILSVGVGHIPENLDDALIGNFSLVENVALNLHYTPEYSRFGIINQEKIQKHTGNLILRYDIRASHEMVSAKTLSGGNKQKTVLARELSRNPKLLIAVHPTRGIDIAAEEFIRNLLLEKRAAGMAIFLISTKLDEIMDLSDRILVIERGRIMGEVKREDADINKIGLLMAGSEE